MSDNRTSYRASNRRGRLVRLASYWTSEPAEVAAFSRDLIRGGIFTTADDVQEYIEKPHVYHWEHEWWDAHDRPDTPEAWENYDPEEER